MNKPHALTGALVGALLTAPLIVVLHLGSKLAGLPFAPFDMFDWMTRLLPGTLVTIGIDSMIKVIRSLNPGSTAGVAKASEQAMAAVTFLVAGIIAGAVLFAAFRALKRRAPFAGLVAGAVVGAFVLLIGHTLDRPAAGDPLIGGLWTMAVFVIWGMAFGWVYDRLRTGGESAVKVGETEKASVERVDRRRFLIRLGGTTAAMTVLGAVVDARVGGRTELAEGGRWSAGHALPNADDPIQPAHGTRPEYTSLEDHYRVDINTVQPVIDEKSWRLKVGGLVERPLELTLDDLRGYDSMDRFITLSCISNPVGGDLIGTTRWTGVSLQRLLPDWRLKPNATHLKINAADGFFEIVALEVIKDDEQVMLAYAWDGVPLTTPHGFPLRIYIPDRHGMKQPKWIQSIEAMDRWEAGYWVERGWDREARMKATSVIDTIAVDRATNGGGQRLVPVGGIAHAGARGISKVEVQVDGGEWREAKLRGPLSGLTWVIWRYDLPFQAGEHTLTVRCYDGSGAAQIVEQAPPHPSGASGLDSKSATLQG